MKVYTKTGDKGTTSLVGGQRVRKSTVRISAYGDVDELNSFVGLLISKSKDNEVNSFLTSIQRDLFAIGGYLATESNAEKYFDLSKVKESTELIEKEIDRISELLPPLRAFILPGGCEGACLSHVCRTVCRRTEREIHKMIDKGIEVDERVLSYMNRLSDYFFVLSRCLNHKEGKNDVVL